MTVSANTHSSLIEIHDLLTSRGEVALIWNINFVKRIRPDLTDEQAWKILLECREIQDCESIFTDELVERVAYSYTSQAEE